MESARGADMIEHVPILNELIMVLADTCNVGERSLLKDSPSNYQNVMRGFKKRRQGLVYCSSYPVSPNLRYLNTLDFS